LHDLDLALESRPPKPIVMGESVLGVGWPDVARYDALPEKPWWYPPGLGAARDVEARINALDGEGAARGLIAVSDRTNLALRKFQTELFRMNPQHAGMVANSLRDVAICPCGLLDDFGRWRFEFDDVRAFMGDAVLLMKTPEYRSAWVGGRTVDASMALSNFSPNVIEGSIVVRVMAGDEVEHTLAIRAAPGEGPAQPLSIALPQVERPTPLAVSASIGSIRNTWTLWALPTPALAAGVAVLADAPFSDEEASLDFEERKYSSGWGLKVETWSPRMPDPTALLPDAQAWSAGTDASVIVTHRLTPAVLDALEGGARVLHLPSKARDSMPTVFFTGFGQVPWIRPVGPLTRFGREWIEDVLEYDLHRRWTRCVCVSELGFADAFEPFVRMLYTHDMATKIKELDVLSATAVGRGVLAICTCDLHDDAGGVLLGEILAWLSSRSADAMSTRLEIEALRACLNGSPDSN
jgi:hypothetical protein